MVFEACCRSSDWFRGCGFFFWSRCRWRACERKSLLRRLRSSPCVPLYSSFWPFASLRRSANALRWTFGSTVRLEARKMRCDAFFKLAVPTFLSSGLPPSSSCCTILYSFVAHLQLHLCVGGFGNCCRRKEKGEDAFHTPTHVLVSSSSFSVSGPEYTCEFLPTFV